MYSYTESGMFVDQAQKLRMISLLLFIKENRVHFSINEYINDMTKFDNLALGNFRMVFAFFFSFGLILLAAFIVHIIVVRFYNHMVYHWLERSRTLGEEWRIKMRSFSRSYHDLDLSSRFRRTLEIRRLYLDPLFGGIRRLL